MNLNTSKCKETVNIKSKTYISRRSHPEVPASLSGDIIGLTLQSNMKFDKHVDKMLNVLNQRLYIIRDLKCNGGSQQDLNKLFKALIYQR